MSSNIRIISRLDIKGENLIKGVHLEGLKVVGDPNKYAQKYYKDGVDEIIYMDSVASLYGRNNLLDIVRKTVKHVYIPITVGGGIRSTDDVELLLRNGAEKVAIGTAATINPNLITDVSKKFGSQCMVLSIEAKLIDDSWIVFVENGRKNTGMDVLEWSMRGEKLYAGEILLTSIDKEGTNNGFDYDLIKAVSSNVSIPVIASGGMGTKDHFLKVVQESSADAVAMADVLHFNKLSISDIRNSAEENNLNVRSYDK